jgi:hypothetical protein
MKKWLSILLICCVFGCGDSKKRTNQYQFSKIIFHTTGCYGWCPIYHLEVDSDKTFKLNAEMVRRNADDSTGDTTKMGYFIGIVPDTTFSNLQRSFEALGIDTLKFNEVTCCDGAIKTIIAYHNGKRTVIRSMTPPIASHKLLGILLTICKLNNLKRSDSKFNIEDVNTLKVSDIRYPPKLQGNH